MEPDRKKIDNFLASSLEGLKTEPSDKVWQGIERKYFRKGAAYWLYRIVPAILLIGSGFTIYSLFFTPEEISTIPGQPAIEIKSPLPVDRPGEEIGIPAPENVPKPEPPAIIKEQSLAEKPVYDEIAPIRPKLITALPFSFKQDSLARVSPQISSPKMGFGMKDDYIRQPEYRLGAQITPSVVYYPGKNNKNSWSGEFTFDYMPSRFSVQAGLGLGYYKEPGEYQMSYSSIDSVGFYYDVASFSLHPDNPDSVLFELDETSIYDTVDNIVISEIQNKYLYLRFPVKLGYNLFNAGKLSCRLYGGFVFSLLLYKDEPEVTIPADDIMLINIEKTYPGRLNTSWQLTAGISFIYRINDRFGLSFEPTYMHYVGKLYKPGFDYSNTRPYAIGLRTGIYVKF